MERAGSETWWRPLVRCDSPSVHGRAETHPPPVQSSPFYVCSPKCLLGSIIFRLGPQDTSKRFLDRPIGPRRFLTTYASILENHRKSLCGRGICLVDAAGLEPATPCM